MKKIAIDARMYGKGSGIARYVETLVHGLEKFKSEFSFSLYLKPEMIKVYQDAGGTLETIEAPFHWYGVEEQTAFLSLIRRGTHDLIHFPHWNVPVGYRRPYVVTIHDLRMLNHPEWEVTGRNRILFWFKDKVRRVVVHNAVRKSSHIIALSNFTKREIVETLHTSAEKISTIYLFPNAGRSEKSDWSEVQKKFELTKKFVLYVGAAYPHKNLYRLVEAWKAVASKFETHELVLVGETTELYKALQKYVTQMGIPRVRLLGLVTDEELHTLYAHTDLMVFPSLYEGFGLPPLEAMREGAPVLASTAGSLPEIVGEAAYYVNPEDTAHIAEGMSAVLGSAGVAHELRMKGRVQVAMFREDVFLKKTHEVYMQALGE